MESHTESCHFRSKSLSKFHFLDGGILEVFADHKDQFVDSTSRIFTSQAHEKRAGVTSTRVRIPGRDKGRRVGEGNLQ